MRDLRNGLQRWLDFQRIRQRLWMVTSGGFNVLGNDGRCSLISREAGFENIGVDAEIDTSTHGNEASFEFVVEKEPDYVFVLDRDAAVGTEGEACTGDYGK